MLWRSQTKSVDDTENLLLYGQYLVAGLRDALADGVTEEERIRHLEGIGAIMENHFAYEERQLIAVLDASTSLSGTNEDLLGPL